MTPEEKVNQLVGLFYNLHAWEVMDADKRKIEYDIAKKAAIICVEQIIEALKFSDKELEELEGVRMCPEAYWEKVLESLKNS